MAEQIEVIEKLPDGRKVRSVFTVISDEPPQVESRPALKEPEAKCIVQQTVVHIRRAEYGRYDRPFGVHPDFWGGRLEVLKWARERSLLTGLAVIDIERKNPRLTDKDFETPGIYLIVEEYDSFSDPGGRCVVGY